MAYRNGTLPQRKNYARIPEVHPLPNLIEMQKDSFEWFKKEGLRELFDEISPIVDFTGTRMELSFEDYEFGDPKYSELECREKDMTFSAPLKVDVDAAACGVADGQLQMIRRRQVDAERVLEELRQHEEVLERFRFRFQHVSIRQNLPSKPRRDGGSFSQRAEQAQDDEHSGDDGSGPEPDRQRRRRGVLRPLQLPIHDDEPPRADGPERAA